MDLERLHRAVHRRAGAVAPGDGAPARAAVALVFRPGGAGSLDLLMIRRADREGDPWSGQVALPGGREAPGDASLLATAVRETLEETGIDLASAGQVVGRLDDLRPRTALLPAIIVTPFVATLHQAAALRLNHEVAEAFWVPWGQLCDPGNTREAEVTVRAAVTRTAAIVVGPHVVWGMTERILRDLMARVEG